MNNPKICRAIYLSMFCLCAATAQSANPIRNNSFEKPVVGDGSFQLFGNNTGINGWLVVGASGNVAIFSTHYMEGGFTFPARSGVQWLDLTGNTDTATGVEQSVATTPGRNYVLRFSVGNTYDPTGNLGTRSTVNVLINGSQVMSATNTRGMGTSTLTWRSFSVTFTASTSTTTITFLNGDLPGDNCNGLDAVSLALAADPQAEYP